MTKKPLFALIAFCVLLSLTKIAVADITSQQLVKEARSEVQSASIHDVKKMFDNDEDLIILDIREITEFEKSHIPGSMHIPRGLLEFQAGNKIPDKNAKIVVY